MSSRSAYRFTVLVDGFLIRGNLMDARRFAKQLDDSLEAGVKAAAEHYGAEDVRGVAAEAWRKGVSGSFERQIEAVEKAREKHHDTLKRLAEEKGVSEEDLGLDDLPDDVAVDEIFAGASRAVLTLETAVLLVPPMWREDPLGTVRIHTGQIAAWWTPMGGGQGPEPS